MRHPSRSLLCYTPPNDFPCWPPGVAPLEFKLLPRHIAPVSLLPAPEPRWTTPNPAHRPVGPAEEAALRGRIAQAGVVVRAEDLGAGSGGGWRGRWNERVSRGKPMPGRAGTCRAGRIAARRSSRTS